MAVAGPAFLAGRVAGMMQRCLSPCLAATGAMDESPGLDAAMLAQYHRLTALPATTPSGTPPPEHLHLEQRLCALRAAFHAGRYRESRPQVEQVIAEIERAIAGGAALEDAILTSYFAAQIMLKAAADPDRIFREGRGKRSTQVLLLDASGERLLLQKRGLFKRLFADTLTVSANAKPQVGERMEEAAAAAVLREVGIALPPGRFELIGAPHSYPSYLAGYDFLAFAAQEAQRLKSVAARLELPEGIRASYDPLKRSLAVFTTDPRVPREAVTEAALQIQRQVGIEPVYPVFDRAENSLMICRLTPGEESQVQGLMAQRSKEIAQALLGLRQRADAALLKRVDADEMCFQHWLQLRHLFERCPESFALDLTAPYLNPKGAWEAMGFRLPQVISADAVAAGHPHIAGGKGANTHFLRMLRDRIPGLHLPKTAIIPIEAFEEVVLADPEVRSLLRRLQEAKTPDERQANARQLRERIAGLKLPKALVAEVRRAFEELGGDVAVRSSANSEDMREHSAAGRADSVLHQVSMRGVQRAILQVWQSLYSDGFVAYRDDIGFPHDQARMAVLLQEFIDPAAAGVLFSLDPGTGRPLYRVSAQPGLGIGVVEGEGRADSWRVGMLGTEILEREIVTKTRRYRPARNGGVRREEVAIDRPSLEDHDILRLVGIAREIHRAYRENLKIPHVDLEFVFDKAGRPFIVQARAKAAPAEVDAEGRPVFRYSVLDAASLPQGVTPVALNGRSQVAYPGAVTAPLQILRGDAAAVRPGVILATTNTNNEFNSVFAALKGVITTDGDPTSHAGQHAFEKKIPCVVGAEGALGILAPYDGQVITFDASSRLFVVGAWPVKEQEFSLSVWLQDEATIVEINAGKDAHEIFRPWEQSKAKRRNVFIEDFEGRWRRRSAAYGGFQLDYYDQAWDRLTEYLNRRYQGRSPWPLASQSRQIKYEEWGRSLLHEVAENDPQSIYHFLTGCDGFGLEECEALFEARWEGFRRFARFMSTVSAIDRHNVAELVDELVGIFTWMHFGFWLDVTTNRFVNEQLQYISDEGSFHNVLRSEALQGMERDASVDPLRPEAARGKNAYLTRNKDQEIYAVLERIRSDHRVAVAFERLEAAGLRPWLEASAPEIIRTIDAWSMRYKLVKEHLDSPSDTNDYLEDLRRRLLNADVPSREILANYFRAYADEFGENEAVPDAIRRNSPQLFLLLRSHARLLAAGGGGVDWNSRAPSERQRLLREVSDAAIEALLPQAIRAVREALASQQELRERAAKLFRDHPRLKRVMALSALELALREDGHHLIVPHQRRIAQMMREAALAFVPQVLSTPEQVFQISTDELIGLFHEKDPSFITRTFERERRLQEAELAMVGQWTVSREEVAEAAGPTAGLFEELVAQGCLNQYGRMQDKAFEELRRDQPPSLSPRHADRRDAVFSLLRSHADGLALKIWDFARAAAVAVEILQQQEAAATIPRLKASYRREATRLTERARHLREKGKEL